MDIDKLLADSSEETVATKETVSSEETAISPRTGKPIQKKYAPKKKCKPRGGNNWLKPENIAPGLEAGDNTKFLSVNMALMNMPDIDMENPLEVQQRLSDYFALYAQYDMKPTVVGMAIALNGHNRQWLYAVTHDVPGGGAGYKIALPPKVADVIKRRTFCSKICGKTICKVARSTLLLVSSSARTTMATKTRPSTSSHRTSRTTTTIPLMKSENATLQATSRSDFQQATLTRTRATNDFRPRSDFPTISRATFDYRL